MINPVLGLEAALVMALEVPGVFNYLVVYLRQSAV